MDAHAEGRVAQVSVSPGGVPKRAVDEAVVGPLGLAGDAVRYTKIHGGPERAVCLFSLDLIEALQAEGHPIAPGTTGENLTLAGVDWARLESGDVVAVGADVRLATHDARRAVQDDPRLVRRRRLPAHPARDASGRDAVVHARARRRDGPAGRRGPRRIRGAVAERGGHRAGAYSPSRATPADGESSSCPSRFSSANT